MNKKELVIDAITSQALLPLFYADSAALSLEITRTLYNGGIRVLEYTNRGPQALQNFKFIKSALSNEMPGLHLGIGTIKNETEAADFIAAGADFIVCPVIDEKIGNLVHKEGLLWIPGCLTPTEINIAYRLNAGIIKLFPANILGPGYVSAIKDIFPGQLFIPTGGVEIEEQNLTDWFSSGICAVGIGSKLISKKILADKDFETLFEATRKTLSMVEKCR